MITKKTGYYSTKFSKPNLKLVSSNSCLVKFSMEITPKKSRDKLNYCRE